MNDLKNDNNGNGAHTSPKLTGLIAWFAGNSVAANALLFLLIIAGAFAGSQVVIGDFPETKQRSVVIETKVLGASPSEVQEHVIENIENAVIGLEYIERVVSVAKEGHGLVNVELKHSADEDIVLNKVRNRVDAFANIIHPGVRETEIYVAPWISDVMIVAVSSDTVSKLKLREESEKLRDSILELPEVSLVDFSGARDREISINVRPEKLEAYGLKFSDVRRAIRAHSVNLTSGQLRTDNGEIVLKIADERVNGDEFRDIPLISENAGEVIRLDDVADIRDAFEVRSVVNELDGAPALFLRIQSIGNQSMSMIRDAINEHLTDYSASGDVKIDVILDKGEVTKQRLQSILINAAIGMVLVFVCLVSIFDLRITFWVTLGIPLSFIGALIFFPPLGLGINTVTLFAFFLLVGITVDDAVVVGDSIAAERTKSQSPLQASIIGARRVMAPLIVGAMTTILAFLPLTQVNEGNLQIISVIPYVVIVVLLVSLIDAFFILPAKLAYKDHWSHPPLSAWSSYVGGRLDHFRDTLIMNSVTWSLGKVWVVVLLGALFFFGSVLMLRTDVVRLVVSGQATVLSKFIQVDLKLPPGASIESTLAVAEKFQEAAGRINEEFEGNSISSISMTVGSKISSRAIIQDQEGSHLATVRAYLHNSPTRSLTTQDVEYAWLDLVGEVPELEEFDVNSTATDLGPAISYSVQHDNESVMHESARKLRAALEEEKDILRVYDTMTLGKRQYEIELTPLAESAGLTPRNLGVQLRQQIFGTEVQRIQRGYDEISVVVRLPSDNHDSLRDLLDLQIELPGSAQAPLADLVNLVEVRNFEQITSIDGKHAVIVEADVDIFTAIPRQVRRVIKDGVIRELKLAYPELTIENNGRSRTEGRIFNQLGTYVPLVLLLMFGIMATLLRSYWKPLLIVIGIPFNLAGAIILHWVLGWDFVMFSIFGVIAVSGVTTNDALLMMDRYNNLKREHPDLPAIAAVAAAARQRFRAVFLTGLTTILGLSPLLYETNESMAFLIPFVVSILGGLVVSLFFVIFLLPALIVAIEGRKEE